MCRSGKRLEFDFQRHRTYLLDRLLALPCLFDHNKNLLGKLNNLIGGSMDCMLSQCMPLAQMHQLKCNTLVGQDTHQ